jgi:hypothetical protein
LDVIQCVDARRVFSRHVSVIGSLGLQKPAVTTAMGFFGVPSPLLTLLLIMVVVLVVAVV